VLEFKEIQQYFMLKTFKFKRFLLFF